MLANNDVLREMVKGREDDFNRFMNNQDKLREAGVGKGRTVGKQLNMPIAAVILTAVKSVLLVAIP